MGNEIRIEKGTGPKNTKKICEFSGSENCVMTF